MQKVRAGKLSAAQAARNYGVKDYLLRRRVQEMQDLYKGNPSPTESQIREVLMPSMGRPPICSESVLQKVKAECASSAMRGNSILNISTGARNKLQLTGMKKNEIATSLAELLEKERTAEKSLLYPQGLAPKTYNTKLSDSVVLKASKTMGLKSTKAEHSNERRAVALNDLRNPISLVACLMAVHNEIPEVHLEEGVMRPELTFNVDNFGPNWGGRRYVSVCR